MKKQLLIILLWGMLSLSFALPRNLVVVEIGTGTWCQYCPGAAMGADELISNGRPVAIIENHNGDNYANTYSNARNSYYAITGFPTARFDGLNPSVGGSNTQSMYSTYLPRVNSRISVPSHYTISATGSLTGNNFSIEVTVAKPEEDTNTNVVLHSAITESEIQQSWQGQDHLNFVNRLMLPNQAGTPVSLATGAQQTYALNGTFDSSWNMNTCEVVLFLQNTSTKEILQGIKYTFPGLMGINPVSDLDLDFPNTYVGGINQVPLTIRNFFGNPVTGTMTTNNPVFTLPQSNFTIAPYGTFETGVIFSPTAPQDYTANLNITSNLTGFNNVTVALHGLGFMNNPPIANNVVVSGPPVIFQDLSVSYDFSDPENDAEGISRFQWMRIMGLTPTPIPDATEDTYHVQVEDMGWQLACQVTPLDEWGMLGTPVMSNQTLAIQDLPEPRNLTGTYTQPRTVNLAWQAPLYFDGRGLIGYRIYRNGATLANVMDPGTLSYANTNVPSGIHEYYVVAIFNNPLNFSNPSNTVSIEIPVANEDELAPQITEVAVYPNPFQAQANFEVQGKANSQISLEIYNLKGQMVNKISADTGTQGHTLSSWNGLDKDGNRVQNGIYLYRVQGLDKQLQGKIIISR